VDSLSSISSSSSGRSGPGRGPRVEGGPPWAALLAVLLVLVIDRLAFGSLTSWEQIRELLHGPNLLEAGVVQDRIELLGLDDREGDEPRVFVVGSSRMHYGFQPEREPPASLPALSFTKLAHPQLFAFEIRAAVEEMRGRDPRVVVLALSEFDTHSRIKLVPGSSFGDIPAIVDLAREAGIGFALERRVMLYRIAFGDFVDAYHYRGVLRRIGLDRVRSFRRDRRLRLPRRFEGSAQFWAGEVKPIADPDLARIVAEFDARFPGRGSMIERAQFGLMRSISRGEHAEISMGLLRRSVAILRAEGAEVIVVEPPVYPGAEALYDASIREDFLAFAQELAVDEGVHFVPLEAGPRYTKEDFGDLTHLDMGGASKFTRLVISLLRAVLEDELGTPPSRSSSPSTREEEWDVKGKGAAAGGSGGARAG
jgi:hypothetical protein